ncbi:hypothetical protein [Oceanibaculum nanhaiense]|uniref:hypothetical protein n=1 Tax=Oceanibaculum nanhaiense TaxID=1909734 RepID=UPI00396DDDA1
MSEAAIQSFLDDLTKDKGLQAQVREMLPASAGKQDVSTAILTVARRSGFDVDAGDAATVEGALVEAPHNDDGELDEAALDKVAGGFGFATGGFLLLAGNGLADTVSNTFSAVFGKR